MTVDDKHACLQRRAAINLIPPVSAISGLDQLSTQPLDMLKYVYDTPRAETLTPHQPFHSLLAQNEQPAFAWHQGCARELPRFITGYPNSIADEAPPHLYLNQSITTGWHHPIGGHAPYSTDSTEVTSLVLCYSLCCGWALMCGRYCTTNSVLISCRKRWREFRLTSVCWCLKSPASRLFTQPFI